MAPIHKANPITRSQITRLLVAWGDGDRHAEAELMPLLYGELRRIAGRMFASERPEHTLQPTALVHEAFLRLLGQSQVRWQNRAHFFALSARIMRRVLIDHARRRQNLKRGAAPVRLSIQALDQFTLEKPLEILALDEALKALADIDTLKASITDMRFFAGMTEREIAEVLEISPATIQRHWRMAKAWLYRELQNAPAASGQPTECPQDAAENHVP